MITLTPALVIALALVAGIICQILARHLRIPGIVLLLAAGVVLGPEILGVIRPSALGRGLDDLVGFAVAVILFEGGLNLNLKRLRREARVIQRLLTIGVVTTLAGAALTVRLLLAWPWTACLLFGSLVIVTGPTVITPLLKRIRVHRDLETVLEAEAILVDAIGAVLAIVALEVVVAGAGQAALTRGLVSPPMRLGFGAAVGLVGGWLLAVVLRTRRLVPEGLANTLTLAWVLALFQVSNGIVPESGVVAAIAAGVAVGNTAAPALRELRDFKEQLTVLLIGMLFVLLAADVRVSTVTALGNRGLLVVVALMIVVRPLGVVLSTAGCDLGWRQKAFLAWVAPRGIVAAAIASLFGEQLHAAGMSGGSDLRALVFLVIAGTVVVQGASAALLARGLKLRRPSDHGYAILGAHALGRLLARLLTGAGEDIVLLDANADAAQAAQDEGLRVIYGNALEDRVQLMAQIDTRRGVVGLLANTAVNQLFAQTSRQESRARRAWIAIQSGPGAPSPEAITDAGDHVLFGGQHDFSLWSVRLRREIAAAQIWRCDRDGDPLDLAGLPRDQRNQLLPLLAWHGDKPRLVDEETRIKQGDEVTWLVLAETEEAARTWLAEAGFSETTRASSPGTDAARPPSGTSPG